MSGGKRLKPPPEPSPTPQPIAGREEDEAKKKVRKPRRGREGTILAGRLMARNDLNILRTRL